jgi:isoleucyl-tRNA synthetase
LLEVRDAVLKSLERARAAKEINSGLEARVELSADGELAQLLRDYAAWLPSLFIVSQVDVVNGSSAAAGATGTPSGLRVTIHRARGAKCERCWNYSTRVGESADYPTVCERCVAALQEIESTAGAKA